MKKKLEEYLPLYLGCCVEESIPHKEFARVFTLSPDNLKNVLAAIQYYKPILRPLSDMTKQEALHIAWFNMDSERHLESDARITKKELGIEIVPNDDGNLVDKDVALVIQVSCRCFIGQFGIYPNGDISLWDDDGKQLHIERIAENVRYMIWRGFDLFGLIEDKLAIAIATSKK